MKDLKGHLGHSTFKSSVSLPSLISPCSSVFRSDSSFFLSPPFSNAVYHPLLRVPAQHTCASRPTPHCFHCRSISLRANPSWQKSHMEDVKVALVKKRAILELNFRNYLGCFENKSSAVKGQILQNPWEAAAHLFMVLNLSRKYQVIIKLFNKWAEKAAKP